MFEDTTVNRVDMMIYAVVDGSVIVDSSVCVVVVVSQGSDDSASTIATIHSLCKEAICYFSAGTYENWRSDASSFAAADLGSAVEGWAGENWLSTSSSNVRAIMTARTALVASKGAMASIRITLMATTTPMDLA